VRPDAGLNLGDWGHADVRPYACLDLCDLCGDDLGLIDAKECEQDRDNHEYSISGMLS
jgi:hypothetical protein